MLNTCMWACKRRHAGMKPLNNHVRLYTVAFGGFHQKRQWSSACEVVCLVHQSLLHCIISYQNNRPLPAQVQCHHRTIDFTELEEDTDIFCRSQRAICDMLLFCDLFPKLTLRKLLKAWSFCSCGRFPTRGSAVGPGGKRYFLFTLKSHSRAEISPAKITVAERSMTLFTLCLLVSVWSTACFYTHFYSVFAPLSQYLCLYWTGWWLEARSDALGNR